MTSSGRSFDKTSRIIASTPWSASVTGSGPVWCRRADRARRNDPSSVRPPARPVAAPAPCHRGPYAYGTSYHVGVWEIAMVLVMLGVLAVIAAPWIMRRRGAGSDWMQGQLLVTGVSPRPDDLTGEQFVTITGVITGPTVNEHVIYQRLAVDVDQWPTMSALFPVVYS